jgi:hypothetical protein
MRIAFLFSALAAGAALGLTSSSPKISPRAAGEVVAFVAPEEPAKRPPIEFACPTVAPVASVAPVATPTFHGAPRYEKSRRAIDEDRRRVLDRPPGD